MVIRFRDWILIGGQNGLVYLQPDNISRVYKQTFEAIDWFDHWQMRRGRLFWVGEHGRAYEVRENTGIPGFLEFEMDREEKI